LDNEGKKEKKEDIGGFYGGGSSVHFQFGRGNLKTLSGREDLSRLHTVETWRNSDGKGSEPLASVNCPTSRTNHGGGKFISFHECGEKQRFVTPKTSAS